MSAGTGTASRKPPKKPSKEQRRLIEALEIRVTPFMPHVPHEKQHAFLWLECFEALFGGAAGGGKSDALLLAALQYVDVPKYSAILFRKTYADLKLPGSLIPRAHEWLVKTDARWNDNDKQWLFPSGATLNFGYMQTDDDRFRYQSSEFQFIGFDELTQFSRLQYTYMVSRLRRPTDIDNDDPLAQVPLRLRGATNPGGRGHLWVKQRFLKPVKDDPPRDPTQRVFIPSKLVDNPSVDQESYTYALMQLDEASRAQLLDGDWDAREPGDWMIPDHTWIDAAEALGRELWTIGPPPPVSPLRFGIDFGEITQGYIIWPLPDGGIFVPPSEVIGAHEDTATVTIRMLQRAERLRLTPSSAHYDAAGIQNMRTFLRTARARKGWERLRPKKIAFNKYKRETITYQRLLFKRTALGKVDRIIAIHPDNVELLRQLRSWERKNEETDDAVKEDDHGPDAVVAGSAIIAAKHRAYIEKMIQRAKGVKS